MEKRGEGTSALLLLLLLQGYPTCDAVQVQASSNPAVVGQTLTLSLSPTPTLRSGSWAVGESLILTWLGDQQAVFPSHTDRVSVNGVTGALTLNSINVADSGVYVMQSTNPQLRANISISVLESISNVTLSTNRTDLMELSDSAVIKCSVASGTSLSIIWMNGSSVVMAGDRVALTDGNFTLTVVNVTRYDEGPFRCFVSNAVSSGSSDPVNITVNYGPDNMELTVNGQNATNFVVGSNLTLLCSAQSGPPALLQWAFRGNLTNVTGPLLHLSHVTEDQSGPYSCLASNSRTNNFTNISKSIEIGKPPISRSEEQSGNGFLLHLLLLVGIISSFPDHVSSQGLSALENPIPVGNNITLHSTTLVNSGIWSFNGHMIVFISPGSVFIFEPWNNRSEYNSTTSSLSIHSATLQDSGLYSLQGLPSHRADLSISVQVPVSNVTLWANSTDLVEHNDTVVLMCSVSKGTSLSYKWLKDNSVVTAGDHVKLSDNNATLSIHNVPRFYEGTFMCNVSNGLNHEVSQHVHLNISYGPSNVTLAVLSANDTVHQTGINITLSVSAESKPPATIQWLFNGAPLNQSGTELILENLTHSHSGNYQCLLHNTVTGRFSSANVTLETLDPITSVVVKETKPAVLHDSFTQHCEVNTAFDTIQWWKDGSVVYADNTTEFGPRNQSLTLNPVYYSDSGNYQCHAFNAVSDLKSSAHTVKVNYGPDTPTITGFSTGINGDNITFNCNATSHPPSRYEWYFNDKLVSNMSEYVTPELTLNMSGKYMCIAFNHVTGRNSSDYIILNVIDPIKHVEVKAQRIPIEGQAFNLSCSVTGPAELIYWMKDNVMMHEDNTTAFSMNNQSIMFTQLHHNHSGNYQCKAFNSYGNMTSTPYRFDVHYGPEGPIIHGPTHAKTGSDAVFNCSAMSVPPSTFSWMHNDDILSNMSHLMIYNLTLNMSGDYTCMAHNNVTGKTRNSTVTLTVFEPIKSVRIHINTPPILHKNFTLICNVVGPYDTIYWMKDNRTLNYPHMNSTHMNSTHMNSTNMNSTNMNSTHMNSTNMNSTNMNSTHMNSTYMNSTHMNSTYMNSTHMNSTYMNSTHMNSTHMNSTYMNSTHMNSTYMNSTHMNSTYMNSTHMNSTYMNSTHMNSTHMNSTYMNSTNMNSTHMNSTNELNMTSQMYYHIENNMLHLTPLMMESDGAYRCVASNQFNRRRSPEYNLRVNYGPINVSISGPETADENSSVTLNCLATSRPECSYHWYLDSRSNPISNGSSLTFSATDEHEGFYICDATNPVTNITKSETHMFTINSEASALHLPSHASVLLTTLFGLTATRVLL